MNAIKTSDDSEETKIIVGFNAIGRALGIPARQVKKLYEAGALPLIKLGDNFAIRKAALRDHLLSLENAGKE